MALSEIQILRLKVGDTDPDFPWLSDEEYQFFIDEYPSKRKREKAIDIAILAAMRNDVHERSGQEERWGNQAFENGLTLVKLKWKDPVFSGTGTGVMFGGVSKEEMAEQAMNPDRVPDTFYKGQSHGRAEWQENRVYRFLGRNLEPYRACPYVVQI